MWDSCKTLEDLNIKNMSIIKVTESDYFSPDSFIIIIFSLGNMKIAIQSQNDKTLEEVALKFCNKVGENINELRFIYNSMEIKTFNKSLYEIGLKNNSVIDVIKRSYVIGGNDSYI